MNSIATFVTKAENNAALSAFKEEFSSMSLSRTTSNKKNNVLSWKKFIRRTMTLITKKKISL